MKEAPAPNPNEFPHMIPHPLYAGFPWEDPSSKNWGQ